jgi:hypothetical protein
VFGQVNKMLHQIALGRGVLVDLRHFNLFSCAL